jgi:hypothetical protein
LVAAIVGMIAGALLPSFIAPQEQKSDKQQ